MKSRLIKQCLYASYLFVVTGGLVFAQQSSSGNVPSEAVNTLNWRSIGPANMGGRITSIAVYEADPSVWWAASASGGLLKTENNGVTFEHQFDREATVSIGDVQVSQSDPNIVWVGTGEANPRNSVSWGDGVYKSTDGGKTWKNMGLKKIFQTGRMAIHPTNPDVVYVGALGRLWGASEDRGLYKTEDGGKTWKKILYVDEYTGVIDLQMNQADPETLLVATYQRKRDGFDGNDPEVKFGPGAGIYRTTDGGKSFAKVSEGLPSVNMGRIGLSIYRKDPKHVYAIIESEKIGQSPDDFPFVGFSGESAEVGARINSVTKDSSAEKGGLQEGDIVVGVDESRVLDYDDLQKAIRAKAAGETAQWQVVRDSELVDLTIEYGKREESEAGQRERGSRGGRGGSNRSPFSASLGGQQANLQGQQGKSEKDFGGVYHSEDGGLTWSRINSVNPRPMYYSQIRVDPSDNNHLYVLGTSLYQSQDGGETFTSDGAGGEVHVDHHSLWIDPNNGEHIILGNDGGLYVSYDRMENWDHHNHVAIGQFYHIGIGANEDYHVYGGMQDNGSWGAPTRVADAGGTENSDWYRVGSGDGFVCLVDPDDPNQIYFESQNGGMGRIHLKTGERGFIRPRPPRGTRYRFNWKTPFLLSSHNPKIHYSAGNHVFRSVSKGDRVVPISPDITNTEEGSGSALTESPREPGVLYVGTTDGALWMTKDDGKHWVNLFDAESLEAAAEREKEAVGPTGEANAERGRAAEGTPQGRSAGGPPGGRRGRGGRSGFIQNIMRRDENGDGMIDASELPANAGRMIQAMDRNGDGKLSKEELESGPGRNRPPAGESDRPVSEAEANEPAADTDPVDNSVVESAEEQDGKVGEANEAEASEERPPSPQRKPAADTQKDELKDGESTVSEAEKDEPPQADANDDATNSEGDAVDASKVAGIWQGNFVAEGMQGADSEFSLVLRVDAEGAVSGSFTSSRSEGEITDGKFDSAKGTLVAYVETSRSSLEIQGKLGDEGTMSGTIEINGGSFSIDFQVKRTGNAPEVAAKPADSSKSIGELVEEPRWVSSLEASRHVDGRCYMTLDGHRSNDDEPYLFVTENYGKSWVSIRANLPTSAGSTRVLREDIVNPNVLYLGCEFSIWVSIDRGASWTRMNSNLPTVAVHEFAQHPTRGELLAGTHGRSIWITDVSGLRQLSTDSLSADAMLYEPNRVIRWRSIVRRGSSGTRAFAGDNPTIEARFLYSLGKNARSAKLTVLDLLGEELFSEAVDTSKGIHQVTWNLRAANGSGRNSRSTLESGEYLVKLRVDGREYSQVLSVDEDPSVEPANAAAQQTELEFWELVRQDEEDEEEDVFQGDL